MNGDLFLVVGDPVFTPDMKTIQVLFQFKWGQVIADFGNPKEPKIILGKMPPILTISGIELDPLVRVTKILFSSDGSDHAWDLFAQLIEVRKNTPIQTQHDR